MSRPTSSLFPSASASSCSSRPSWRVSLYRPQSGMVRWYKEPASPFSETVLIVTHTTKGFNLIFGYWPLKVPMIRELNFCILQHSTILTAPGRGWVQGRGHPWTGWAAGTPSSWPGVQEDNRFYLFYILHLTDCPEPMPIKMSVCNRSALLTLKLRRDKSKFKIKLSFPLLSKLQNFLQTF